jgi:hypothetical protein
LHDVIRFVVSAQNFFKAISAKGIEEAWGKVIRSLKRLTVEIILKRVQSPAWMAIPGSTYIQSMYGGL